MVCPPGATRLKFGFSTNFVSQFAHYYIIDRRIIPLLLEGEGRDEGGRATNFITKDKYRLSLGNGIIGGSIRLALAASVLIPAGWQPVAGG
jgi:hypothetical protein